MGCYERALQCNPELKVARTNLAVRFPLFALLISPQVALTAPSPFSRSPLPLPCVSASRDAALRRLPCQCRGLQVVLTDLGTRHKDEGRLQTAIAFYERAASICPQHADVRLPRGQD